MLLQTLLGLGFLTTTTAAVSWRSSGAVTWSMDCDFASGDLRSRKSSGEQCGPLCESTRDCSHFAWNNYNGGTCWLKKGPVSPGSAFHKSGVVCGYLPSRIDGAGGGGGAGSKYTFYLF